MLCMFSELMLSSVFYVWVGLSFTHCCFIGRCLDVLYGSLYSMWKTFLFKVVKTVLVKFLLLFRLQKFKCFLDRKKSNAI